MNIGESLRRATLARLLEKFTLEHVDVDACTADDTATVTLTLKRRRSILERAGFVTKAEAWHKALEDSLAEAVELDAGDPDPAAYPDPAGELEAERELERQADPDPADELDLEELA